MQVEEPLGWLAAVTFALGCSQTAPAAAAPTQAAPTGILRYMPLEDGTVFSYETSTTPTGERGLLVLEVRRPSTDTADLVVAGRARRVTITTDAVAYVAGGFLLRNPLVAGAEWQGDFGHVRVTRVDASVTVGAGTFSGCVETLEELATRDGEKRTTTAFCPGVGITLRETEVEQGGEHQSERIALKNFGKRFDPTTVAEPAKQ
jgi:hypothetical protein